MCESCFVSGQSGSCNNRIISSRKSAYVEASRVTASVVEQGHL